MKNFAISIHGGAGTILRSELTNELEKEYLEGLSQSLQSGYNILEKGGSAIDAVENALALLEDNPLFNAGCGAVFNHQGKHELDASIMDGKTLNAGAVAGVQGIKNPIKLARAVMERSQHVFLSSRGAEEFAKEQGFDFMPESYFFTEKRHQQWMEVKDTDQVNLDHTEEKKFGTAGAVALDMNGNLAAATSTGGMTNKRYGRVGDTPVIGAGTYANNKTCAVSCTGHGEFFIRAIVAYDISCLIEYKGFTLHEACEEVVYRKLLELGGEGGLVAIDYQGNIEMVFNSEGMYRACKSNNSEMLIKIFED